MGRRDERVPFNTGVLAMAGGWRMLAKEGWWDQDAFAVYVQKHSLLEFKVTEHRVLQSFHRPGFPVSHWQPGDFAAHVTGLRGRIPHRLHVVREFVEQLEAGLFDA